ncbi:hypothetical protein [Spirosoma terrae]
MNAAIGLKYIGLLFLSILTIYLSEWLVCRTLRSKQPQSPHVGRFSCQPEPAQQAQKPACRDVHPVDPNPATTLFFSLFPPPNDHEG